MKEPNLMAKLISTKKGKITKKNIAKKNFPKKLVRAKKVQKAKAGSQRDENQDAPEQDHSIESINFDDEWNKIDAATVGSKSNREKCLEISMSELDSSNVDCTPATTDKSEPIEVLLSICKQTLGRVKLIEKRLIEQNCKTVLKASERKVTQSESFLKGIGLPYDDVTEFNKFNGLLEDKDFKDSVFDAFMKTRDSPDIASRGTEVILRLFIGKIVTKNLLSYYTWTGKSTQKYGKKQSFCVLEEVNDLLCELVAEKSQDTRYNETVFQQQMVRKILKNAYSHRDGISSQDSNEELAKNDESPEGQVPHDALPHSSQVKQASGSSRASLQNRDAPSRLSKPSNNESILRYTYSRPKGNFAESTENPTEKLVAVDEFGRLKDPTVCVPLYHEQRHKVNHKSRSSQKKQTSVAYGSSAHQSKSKTDQPITKYVVYPRENASKKQRLATEDDVAVGNGGIEPVQPHKSNLEMNGYGLTLSDDDEEMIQMETHLTDECTDTHNSMAYSQQNLSNAVQQLPHFRSREVRAAVPRPMSLSGHSSSSKMDQIRGEHNHKYQILPEGSKNGSLFGKKWQSRGMLMVAAARARGGYRSSNDQSDSDSEECFI